MKSTLYIISNLFLLVIFVASLDGKIIFLVLDKLGTDFLQKIWKVSKRSKPVPWHLSRLATQ